jgi:hypothetical protein
MPAWELISKCILQWTAEYPYVTWATPMAWKRISSGSVANFCHPLCSISKLKFMVAKNEWVHTRNTIFTILYIIDIVYALSTKCKRIMFFWKECFKVAQPMEQFSFCLSWRIHHPMYLADTWGLKICRWGGDGIESTAILVAVKAVSIESAFWICLKVFLSPWAL